MKISWLEPRASIWIYNSKNGTATIVGQALQLYEHNTFKTYEVSTKIDGVDYSTHIVYIIGYGREIEN